MLLLWPVPHCSTDLYRLNLECIIIFIFFVFSSFDLRQCNSPSYKHFGYPPVCVCSYLIYSVCVCLCVFVSLFISDCVSLCRLSVQTVSHEPLLGPEAVLESGEAWREHRHSAPQQAPCKQSDDTFTTLQSLPTRHYTQTCPHKLTGERGERTELHQIFILKFSWYIWFRLNAKLHSKCIKILYYLCIYRDPYLMFFVWGPYIKKKTYYQHICFYLCLGASQCMSQTKRYKNSTKANTSV